MNALETTLVNALEEARGQIVYLRDRLDDKARRFTTPSTEFMLDVVDKALRAAASDTACDHNEMVANDDPQNAWKCAKCGYVYGKGGTP